MKVPFDFLLISDKELNTFGRHELIVPQSFEVMLEIMENPIKNTVMITSSMMMYLRKRKNSGIPGPRKESCYASMLQLV